MADFPAVFNLGRLDGSNGFTLVGIDEDDFSGFSVSDAGDVNGDGFDDIIIGAPGSVFATATSYGESYVVFGKAGGFAPRLDLAALHGSNGFRLDGLDADDQSGHSVSSAGDVNGDGIDDILIGAFGGNSYVGESYVVFGKASGFAASLDLAALDGSNGFRVDGRVARSGYSVSSAGDVNGDGFDDIIIGAPGSFLGGFASRGESHVVFGKADGFAAHLDLATLDGSNGFRLVGIDADDHSGGSVSSAGDVNGDGFDDIIIGAYYADDFAGESYVVFGKAGGFAPSLDLAALDGANGFRVDGVDRLDESGRSVSGAGDVNGDGFDDVIIGAFGGIGYGASPGTSYVVFGMGEGFAASLDLATLDGSNGFRLVGRDAYDVSGYSVSGAGDVNGDGFDDIVIGARGRYGDTSGGSYVVFGKVDGFSGRIDLGDLDGSDGIRLDGVSPYDFAGNSVSAAGDINGDGFDDIIIGASEAGPNGDYSGESYVIFGRAPSEAVKRIGSDAGQTIRGGDFGDTLAGCGGDDALFGSGGDDRLAGNAGEDTLRGGGGNDQLAVRGGGDRLVGGGGADLFGLNDDLSDSSTTLIVDFTSGTDLFAIDAEDFGGGLTPGALDPDAFVVNATGQAGDANDRFIYNSAKGLLFYDADGTGAGDAVLLAKLNDAPIVTADDFLII